MSRIAGMTADEVEALISGRICEPVKDGQATLESVADHVESMPGLSIAALPITDEDRVARRLRFVYTLPFVYTVEFAAPEADGSEAPPCRP